MSECGVMKVVRAIVFLLLLSATPAFALVLDWSTATWNAGSLSRSFDVDSDGKNDIRVAFSGDTSAISFGYPSITTDFQGGLASPVSALSVYLDFTDPSQSITVTVTFLGFTAAGDVGFSLYDVDADRKGSSSNFAYQDEVRNLTGKSNKTGTVIPSVTTGSQVVYSGGVADGQDVAANTGTGSGDGNVGVSFGQEINSFSFTYGSTTSNITGGDPDPQEFAIGNISFRKVPEVGTAQIAALLCFGAVALRWGKLKLSRQS
jgi:hypothetical protein